MSKRNLIPFLFLMFAVLFLWSCARVKYLPLESSMTYPPTDSARVYWDKPETPYTELGVITAESSDYGEEELMDRLKEKAMSIGAHGIIMRSRDQRVRTIPVPGTTMTPRTMTRRLSAMAIRFSGPSPSSEIKPPAHQMEPAPKPQIVPSEKPAKSTQVTSPSDQNNVTVTGTFANIRSGAGEEFAITTIVKQGDRLILLGEYGGWYHVRLENGQEGWIDKRFVK